MSKFWRPRRAHRSIRRIRPLQQRMFQPRFLCRLLRRKPAETRNNEKECRSPVTGMVISIEATPGQAVEANQVVMVLESMKMEMQITAPQAAVVKSVLVIPGSSVKVNQLLVEFE